MKILIVDDNHEVLKGLQKGLKERFGDEVEVHITCNTPVAFDDAIEFLSKNIYDIILLDGFLSESLDIPPGKKYGYGLISEIKNSDSLKAKIIMISSNEDMNRKGVELGASISIPKLYFLDKYNEPRTSFFEDLNSNFESPYL